MSEEVGLTSFWISKTIQKLLLGTQAQEKVLRTGFSFISSEWGDGKFEAAGRRGAHPPAWGQHCISFQSCLPVVFGNYLSPDF